MHEQSIVALDTQEYMMSEDYVKGFKDGFAAGLEEGKKLNSKSYNDGFLDGMKMAPPTLPPYVPPTTPMPTWWQMYPNVGIAHDAVVRGAVGAEVSYAYGMGANGPVGTDEKQYDDRGWRIK